MIPELEMAKSAGKNIKVALLTNEIMSGLCRGFTQAIDNDPDIASIVIEDETGQLHGYGQDEIDSIEVIE